MDIKLKSLFKIGCYALTIVILCCLKDKYNIFFKNPEKADLMSREILSTGFEVFGKVQGNFLLSTNCLR